MTSVDRGQTTGGLPSAQKVGGVTKTEHLVAADCGRAFLDAFTARDWIGLERAFDSDARLRAVVPNKERPFRDREGAADAAAQIRLWFQDADVFEVLESTVD